MTTAMTKVAPSIFSIAAPASPIAASTGASMKVIAAMARVSKKTSGGSPPPAAKATAKVYESVAAISSAPRSSRLVPRTMATLPKRKRAVDSTAANHEKCRASVFDQA